MSIHKHPLRVTRIGLVERPWQKKTTQSKGSSVEDTGQGMKEVENGKEDQTERVISCFQPLTSMPPGGDATCERGSSPDRSPAQEDREYLCAADKQRGSR